MSLTVEDILGEYPCRQEYLISAMQDIQQEFGYLSENNLIKVSRHFNLPSSVVYGTASFYNEFRFSAPGRFHIRLCHGSACHLLGSDSLLGFIKKTLQIGAGETSRNGDYSLELTDCMGACHQAPLISINNKYYTNLTESDLRTILEDLNNNTSAHE